MAQAIRQTVKQVKPILSQDSEEARRRVISLYKAWYRQIPFVGKLLNCHSIADAYYIMVSF